MTERKVYIDVPVYIRERDPWRAVRDLMTCPDCGWIWAHSERGDPRAALARLVRAEAGMVQMCGRCGCVSEYDARRGIRVRVSDATADRSLPQWRQVRNRWLLEGAERE